MDTRSKQLLKQGEALFSKRVALMSYWQEVAEHFYPERADFTLTRHLGDEFAEHLVSSYPIMVRRDLGNAIGAMLRRDEWFHMRAGREEWEDHEAKGWLEWATGVQRRAMYDGKAKFKRAVAEGDHDYAAFGQNVISVEIDRQNPSLLYRNWHLRDCAWSENRNLDIDEVHRKWKVSASELIEMFGEDKVHLNVKKAMEKEPHKTFECRHCVVTGDSMNERHPWMSIYIDVDNEHLILSEPMNYQMYCIARWQTVSGSQYAYSPATVAALPDARLLQSITEVLLTAGEKFVDPPMLAVQEAIAGDVDIRRGGVTWVDAEYDERLGEVLRPLTQDKSGLPAGFDIHDRVREDIMNAFYLNKLTLPIMAGDMTATEVSQRVEEYIRQSLPLFEPMEADYNGQICDRTFEVMMLNGAFGSQIPDSLAGRDVEFRFESPLQVATERKKVTEFREALELSSMAAETDPTLLMNVDFNTALRGALEGAGVDPNWLRSEEQVQEMVRGALEAASLAGQSSSAPEAS